MYQNSLSTKEKILLSATQLLNQKDTGQISIANVVKEAGVAVGLINYHFQTKEKLEKEKIIILKYRKQISYVMDANQITGQNHVKNQWG